MRVDVACRGKYLADCEGDDFWHRNDKLQRQVDYLECHPGCGMVASDYDFLRTQDLHRIQRYRHSSGRPVMEFPSIENILTGDSGVLTCSVLARRELIRKVQHADRDLYGSDRFRMGDTQTWAEISLLSHGHCIDQSLATHLILEESATQSKDKTKIIRFRLNGAELCLYLCDKHNLPENLRVLHEETWTRYGIRLTFLERDADFAETVRTKFGRLSLKDKVWYWGAKHSLSRWVVVFRSNLLNSFRREKAVWSH